MKLVFAVIQRIFYAAILLLAVIVLNFFMMHLAPGDIADSIAQTMGGADEEIMKEIRADYGLDKPFLTQLGQYILKVAQFDLGYSYFYTQPVTTLILAKLPLLLEKIVFLDLRKNIILLVLFIIGKQMQSGGCNFFGHLDRHF